jgi:hypothetical protein
MFQDMFSFPFSGLMTTRMIRLLVFNLGYTLFNSTLGNLLHSINTFQPSDAMWHVFYRRGGRRA